MAKQPSSDFQNAATYLSSASSLAKVSTPIKLEVHVYVIVCVAAFNPDQLDSYMGCSNLLRLQGALRPPDHPYLTWLDARSGMLGPLWAKSTSDRKKWNKDTWR